MDTQLLNMLVKKLIAEHTGGTEFFNALDKAVTDEPFFDILYDLASKDDAYRWIEDDPEEYGTIASGKFGMALSNWIRGTHFKPYHFSVSDDILLVPGDLRHNPGTMNLFPFAEQIDGQTFIFMDDSFFKGRTRNIIAAELERLGGQLAHTYVVYDGSREPDPRVTSLYRYYDEIGAEGNEPEVSERQVVCQMQQERTDTLP